MTFGCSSLSEFNFITEAINREQYYDGKKHDVVFMTVLKGEWEKQGVRFRYTYDEYGIKELPRNIF